MADKFRVSQSKMKTFRRCHQAYDYKYVQKLRKKRKSRPLQFGTMIHKALEYHLNGDEAMEYFDDLEQDVAAMKLFAQERDEYGDILEDARDIIASYLEYWKKDDIRPVRKAKRGAEHTFEIELFPDIIWNGKIDAIAKTTDKLRLMVEHKTFSRRANDDARWRDLQSTSYFRANDILGWPSLDGCLWDYIKSKPPAQPGILKDGSFSTKKIDTLPSTCSRVLSESPEALEATKPQAIKAIEIMAEKNQPQYFERVKTRVNHAVADMIFKDFQRDVILMTELHGKSSSMNIDKHCSWCDYEPLCRARLQGLDFDYVKEREYVDGTKVKDDRDETPPVHTAVFEQNTKSKSRKPARSKGK